MPYSSQEHNSHVEKRGPPIDREHHSHNGWNPPPQQGHRPGPNVANHVDGQPATYLEIVSKQCRTLQKHAPLVPGDCVVMCRYNPTHILDVNNIDYHQRHCKDRLRLENFGCSFRE
ncbi:hypothetical protein V3C99_012559, partial [Haemonchus contortus]